MLEVDLPDVLAELTAAFDRYERALIGNDIAALNELFWESPQTLRYGARASELLYGHAEIAAFRIRRGPIDQRRTLRNRRITTFGRDFGISQCRIHSRGLRRGGAPEPDLGSDGARLEDCERPRLVRNVGSRDTAQAAVRSAFSAAGPPVFAPARFSGTSVSAVIRWATATAFSATRRPALVNAIMLRRRSVGSPSDGHQPADAQAIDHALDGGGVQIDQTPEMVLRTRPDFGELGQRGELGLGQIADHARCENRSMPLHGDPHEKADLVFHDVVARGRGPGGGFLLIRLDMPIVCAKAGRTARRSSAAGHRSGVCP